MPLVRCACETDWLVALAARASTLGERLAGDVAVAVDPNRAERRLRHWSEVVARSDEQQFEQRVALDRHDRRSAAAVVGEAVASVSVPEWARLVADGLEHAGDPDLEDDRLRAGGEQIP